MPRLLPLGLMVVLLGACAGTEPASILQAGPRTPDAEGAVVDVSFERIVLDTGEAFRINPEVESFTTRGHVPTSLLTWQDKYVHIGLNDENEAVWVAGIGVIVKQEAPYANYTGVFAGLDDEGRAVFEDGTVLRLDDGLELPDEGSETLARIDPERQMVTELRPQGAARRS